MGYETKFQGVWKLNKKLDDITYKFLVDLSESRRMKRNVISVYGVEGEFFTDGGQSTIGSNIIDINSPPKTQPSLHCDWAPTEDRMGIEFNDSEKFYNYIEWIEYIISKVLAPRGYVLNGVVKWRGEEFSDTGKIEICDNMVNGKRLIVDYSINKLLGNPDAKPKKISIAEAKKLLAEANSKTIIAKAENLFSGLENTPFFSVAKKETRKEKDARQIKELADKVAELEAQLAKKATKKTLSTKDTLLESLREKSGFKGSLEDYKKMLRNLLED